jgi:arachidonate 15-lipoxygenase (second type)/8-lipoxygenase (S-type)
MFTSLSWLLLALRAAAAPAITRAISDAPYSLPMTNSNATVRAVAILDKREGFLYGPSICGNVSYWPTGSLGNSTTESDFTTFTVDSQYIQAAIKVDETTAAETITAVGGSPWRNCETMR